MPIDNLWSTVSTGDEARIQRCVSADLASFQFAAGLLIDYCEKLPDRKHLGDLNGLLTDVNYVLRDRLLQIARQLMSVDNECGGNVAFKLRNNPFDPCLIDQSFDGGATWEPAFTMEHCINQALSPLSTMLNTQTANQMAQDFGQIMQDNFDTYDGNVLNVYPDAAYGDADDADRDIALCYAVSRAVDTVCDGIILAFDEQEKRNGLALLAIGAGVGLFIVGTIVTAGSLAAAAAALGGSTGLALSAVGAGAGIASWLNTVLNNGNREAYQDQAAREDVKCALYAALMGLTLSESVYANALNSHGLTGNAGVIANAMDAANAVPENFAGFAKLAEQSFAAVKAGIITEDDCSCTATTWSWTYPTDSADWSDWTKNLFNGALCTESDNKIAAANGSGGAIYFDFSQVITGRVTGIEIDIEWQNNGSSGMKQLHLYIDGTLAKAVTMLANDGTITLSHTFDLSGAHTYRFLSGVYGTLAGGQYLRATEVRITGIGDNPLD